MQAKKIWMFIVFFLLFVTYKSAMQAETCEICTLFDEVDILVKC